MDKEEILKRSREENRKGDELEKMKYETSLNKGYIVATSCLFLLAASCYIGVVEGSITIYNRVFNFEDVIWAIVFLSNLVECSYKYVYFKKIRHFVFSIFWLCGLVACMIVMFR